MWHRGHKCNCFGDLSVIVAGFGVSQMNIIVIHAQIRNTNTYLCMPLYLFVAVLFVCVHTLTHIYVSIIFVCDCWCFGSITNCICPHIYNSNVKPILISHCGSISMYIYIACTYICLCDFGSFQSVSQRKKPPSPWYPLPLKAYRRPHCPINTYKYTHIAFTYNSIWELQIHTQT